MSEQGCAQGGAAEQTEESNHGGRQKEAPRGASSAVAAVCSRSPFLAPAAIVGILLLVWERAPSEGQEMARCTASQCPAGPSPRAG